jgi:hypothetical protein
LAGNVPLGAVETSAKGCTPMCNWNCVSSPCEEVCKPVCEVPQCQTRCTASSSLAGCAMSCDTPKCTTFCRKPCANGQCPWCTTQCSKPECTMKCPDQACHEVCNSPLCKWDCQKPDSCPEPDCSLTCEPAACEIGGGYRDFAPLQPGEIVVNTFPAPQPYAASLLQQGVQSNTSAPVLKVEVSRAVQDPKTKKMSLEHHSTINLPVSHSRH